MPSKLSVHLGSYPPKVFDVFNRMRPSVVKVFNQSSEINIGQIMGTTPNTVIIYRQYTDLDYHTSSADQFFAEIADTFNKLAGRGLYWEGLNEPIVNNADEAKLLSKWFTRFAQIMHERGEKVAGFSWSTGNPHPDLYPQIIPYLADCAALMDLHAFHEYYTTSNTIADWGLYRRFEEALPAYARKPVVITEAGYDDTGQASSGGWRGKVTAQQYLEILKAYDNLLMEDPYVLGATVYQWGDGAWPSFELDPMIDLFANYVQSVGGGAIIPRPFPIPTFRETFSATASSILLGDSTTLQWQVTGATSVYLDGQLVAAQDSVVVSPAQTTTYTLRIVYPDNTIKELTQTIVVTAVNAVHLTNVAFNPLVLKVGDVLNVSITVRNDTTQTIQTQGPDPGLVYNEGETFASRGFPAIANAYRVGVDFDGRTGIDHPYRWGLGAPLAPGQSVTVTGGIKIKTLQNVKYWAALARELVAWEQDHKGDTAISVTSGGQVQITNITLTPATVRAGDLLNVSMTVHNGTTEILQTQGPDPGFVYDEGDTFESRGFASVRDAFRVGIDFEGRAGIDHPYRWGLGAPLAPGQSAIVTGAIRLKTVRSIGYWAGLVRELVSWLQDRQGVQTITVTPAPSGVLEITNVQFAPTILRAGEIMNVRITVHNGTNETIATMGPDPGFVYEEGDDFRSRGYTEIRGAYRVGVDFDGRDGVDHPYRWGLGAPLAPGQSVTVTGGIRLKTPRTANYWVGLAREQIAWLQDRKGVQSVKVNPGGVASITSVTFTPTSLPAGNLLNVSIVVKNDSPNTLTTQGPDPGLVYNEGETFASRGFPAIANAYRVGVDFDGRTGIDHPYRWGLGKPLAPGESVTITGAIRLKTQRTANFWAGFVLEQVVWAQDRQGVQSINVTAPVPPPQPTLTLSASSITVGQSATLTWNAPQAQSVMLNGVPVNPQGTQTVAPTQTTTYTLNVVYIDNSVRNLTTTLTVNPAPSATLTATPGTITLGAAATLQWNTTAAVSATLNGNAVATSGSQTVSPTQTTTYTLHVVFADGTTRDVTTTVVVNVPPSVSFTATPGTIAPGGSATLTWNTTGATLATLASAPVSAGNAPIIDNAVPVATTGTQIVKPTESTRYWLHVVFANGTSRDEQTIVNVSTQPQPTKPPTVSITPENIARLKTYPRPTNDNGRGLHFNIDLSDATIARVVPHLQSIGCRWTLIYAPDENQAKRAAQGCWNAGIMPVVRIGKKVDEPFDPVVYVNVLKAIGAPPYVQIYNEPGDNREWKNWPGDDKWVGIFAARWAQAAIAVFDAGGYPGLQVLGKDEFYAAVNSVKAQNRTDIFARTFFALHNYGANHPPAYPYDPRNQQDHPGATILDDDTAVLNFLEFAVWMQDAIGFVLPFIGGEGGWQYGAQEDPRYPKVEQQLHAQYHKEMFEWFRTGILSNGEPLPDYLFSVAPWIEGGWGGDDWWGGPLGDKTDTIQAVQAIPSFVRQFSWDNGTVLPPAQTVSFTATPDTVDAGGIATLQWKVTGALSVELNGAPVANSGSQQVTPDKTTIYTLHIVFIDHTIRDVTALVTVRPPLPPSGLVWDSRLDPLGIKLTRATQSPAWRVISALFQDETESSLNHNIYFTVQTTNGMPAVGVKVVVDWVGRSGGDQPAEVVTDANGQANIPIWAILHLAHPDGPYFAYIKGAPSDQVSGMGLPENRHVNYLLTFKFQ